MLFKSALFVAVLALGSSAVSAIAGQSELPTTTLTRRQNLAAANLCANVNIGTITVSVAGLLDATVTLGSTCICVDASGNINNGANLRTAISLANPLLTNAQITAAVNALTPNALAGVATQGGQCPTLPADATRSSTCGDTCGFTCNSPLVKNQAGTACVAAVSQRRKRDQLALEKPGACAWGMQACSVIGISGRRTSKFECLDTKTSIESCGGCMFPLRNQPAGEDCTLIPMVESVSCNRGRCAVSSCVRGFEVSESGDSCVKVAKK